MTTVLAVLALAGSVLAVILLVGALLPTTRRALQVRPRLEGDGCDPANPCSIRWVEQLGFWTIPRMATVAFVLIVVALTLDRGRGQPAPTLTGVDPMGDPVTIDPGVDGPMVVAFVAHWCPHCQAEVPRLVDVAGAEGESEGVELAAVATGSDPGRPNFPPGEWLESEGWPGPVLVDSEAEPGQLPTAAAAYGESGFPFMVAIDADGDVVARASGEQDEDGLRDMFAAAAGRA